MKILSVVGARPQFIKASTISRRLRDADAKFAGLTETLVHTGQHYDDGMSAAFFRELEIPEPRWNLAIGSGSHGEQTGAIMKGLEQVMAEHRPDMVLVYGDTNSTLAAALTASKAGVPLAHVEAGLRSHRRGMAEEVNRVVTDRLSDVLFCPTSQAVANLKVEGRDEGVHLVGDVMYDAFLHLRKNLDASAPGHCGVEPGRYILVTVHRAESTDDPARLAALFEGIGRATAIMPVVLPLHPRTRKRLEAAQIAPAPSIRIVEPVPHGTLISLAVNAAAIATDSGGLQKEAYFAGVPCVTLRDETEWVESLAGGWNRLAPLTPAGIAEAVSAAIGKPRDLPPPIYGDGDAAGKILTILAAAQ
jgi:UDP-N-acetylglucosamine 2-epimerase